jgi:hypothetical protein
VSITATFLMKCVLKKLKYLVFTQHDIYYSHTDVTAINFIKDQNNRNAIWLAEDGWRWLPSPWSSVLD